MASCSRSYSARAAGEVRRSPNSEMSAPEAKALSPAPVRITARTSRSACSASSRPGSATRISLDRALRLPGLLMVTTATAPATSTRSLPVPVLCRAGGLGGVMRVLSDHALGAEPVDLRARVAEFGEHLAGVVAGIRARRPDGGRRIGHPHRVAEDVQPAKGRVLHWLGHRQVLDLRVG